MKVEYGMFRWTGWRACDHPERPVDLATEWHGPESGCLACAIAFVAAVRRGEIEDEDNWLARFEAVVSERKDEPWL